MARAALRAGQGRAGQGRDSGPPCWRTTGARPALAGDHLVRVVSSALGATLPRTPACLPLPHPPACSDIYGKRSDRVLASLWQTLLLNLVINGVNPRIDHWWVVSSM